MCGICGWMKFDGAPVDPGVIDAMTSSLAHRGPDDSGTHITAGLGLGHRRLSIIDLSPAGHQPMSDPEGLVTIVFNGEIYNFPELRRGLVAQGVALRSNSDTEVILELYKQKGAECFSLLRGMFALAIWDSRKRELVIARDRVGIKPLYYYLDARQLVFGSEIKALLQVPGLDRQLSDDAICTFFTFGHSFAPQTIFEKVKKLPAGHYAVIRNGGAELVQYWNVDPTQTTGNSFDEELVQFERVLSESVRIHLLADVPVGVFLSGGLDSGVIAAIASQYERGIKTFSVGFDVGGHYNETEMARIVAKHIGSDHHELTVTAVDVPNLLETLVWHYDEPFADAAALPTLLLSRFTKEHVTVALSGEGGDELFGGYRRYITQLASARYAWLSGVGPMHWLTSQLSARIKGFRRVKKVLESAQYADDARRYAHWLTSFTGDMRAALFAGHIADHNRRFDPAKIYLDTEAKPTSDELNRWLYLDVKLWLPDTYLEKVDKATMAASLEARVPFLDHVVVEQAFAMPQPFKINGLEKKRIVRALAKKLLPATLLQQPKHGFAVPIDEWFRGPLLGYVREILLDSRTSGRGYFQQNAIENLINLHVSGHSDLGTQLWQLLNFELWQRRFVDSEA